MNKFKAGDKVRALEDCGWSDKGGIYTVSKCWYNPRFSKCYVRLEEHLSKSTTHSHYADSYELVEPNPVLTPEEVFEHLRKGTKLQIFGLYNTRTGSIEKWLDAPPVELITYNTIVAQRWRIKPEPEVIVLNGKKYREIVE